MKPLIASLSGILFGAGLVISGMTDPFKVLGFLDLAGRWDPTLAFVMGSGLLVTVPGFWLVRRRVGPVFETKFYLPTVKDVDTRLLVGAAIFGTGWGVAGFCPGPAIASLVRFDLGMVVLVIALIAGMALAELLPERRTSLGSNNDLV